MKKFFTLFFFGLSMMIGIQDLTAQEQQRPEAVAKIQVANLNEPLALNDEQQRTLFRIFLEREVSLRKQVEGKDLSNPQVVKARNTIESTFEKKVKETLTPEQFKKFNELRQE